MTISDKRQPEEYAWLAEAKPAFELLLSLWQRARLDWNGTQSMVRKRLRAAKISSRERRAVSDCLFGLIRNLRRIDRALELGGWRSGQRAPDRERILAYLVLDQGLDPVAAAAVAPALTWNEVARVDEVIAAERSSWRRVALAHSLPDWLSRRLVRQLGDEAFAFASASNERAPISVRVNRLRSSVDEVLARWNERGVAARRSEWSADGLVLEAYANVSQLPEFQEGAVEIQDEASQVVAELVGARAEDVVVDLCAGAGGKTLALAAQMGGRGRIIAGDASPAKLTELRKRCRRAGVSNVHSTEVAVNQQMHWPAPLAESVGSVTRLLIDAPCSGIGAFRREPQARWGLTEADVKRVVATQRAICARAVELLAPGGHLIYATCTVLAAENDEIVEGMLAANSDLELVSIESLWGAERANAIGDGVFLRMTPHRHGTDGFFAAVLRRR